MRNLDSAYMWWDRIFGPSHLVNEVLGNLSEGNHVLLSSDFSLPWPGTLYEIVKDKLGAEQRTLVHINASEFGNFGISLINNFAHHETRFNFRGTTQKQAGEFILENNLLCGKVLWIHGAKGRQFLQWRDFIRQFKTQRKTNRGLFILERVQPEPSLILPTGFTECNANELISNYDTLMFCLNISSELSYSDYWKQYIASVAAEFFGENALLAEQFISETYFLDDPLFDNAKAFVNRGSVKLSDEEIEKCIWRAQIKIAYPLIQQYHSEYINAYYDQIDQALNSEGNNEGEPMKTPYDAELGLLVYLCGKKLEDGKRLLYFHGEDYENLQFLHQRRNALAHMNCCSPSELDKLFSNNFTPNFSSSRVY